jgi:Bacterial Ig domain/Bacterial cadherin-like domain/RTX calcium-binding nonapeptide repeat (4 copies)
LVGTPRGDVIVAGAGDDVVRGRGGADLICDGDGDDRVEGGAGDDEIGGGRGEDRLEGGSGDDWLAGRRGADVLVGGRGDDRLVGERGDDRLRGNAGDDRLGGGPGNDRCVGGGGTDVLRSCESGDPPDVPGGTPTPGPTPGPGPVDQPPAAVNDAATMAEDSAAQDVPVLANDTDPDGGPKSIASVTQPANGTVQITGGGTGLSYQPDPDYCNAPPGSTTDDFTYTLAPGGSSGSVAMTVTCLNEAPSVVTSLGALSYTEGDAATALDPLLMLLDPDDTSLEGATVRISAGFQSGDELLFTDQLGITGTYDSGTGVLTLTGMSAVADYQTALRSVEFRHAGDDPATSKSVEFRADDGDGLGPASMRSIAIAPVNDAPALAGSSGSASFVEGAGPVALDPGVGVTDPDSDIQSATVTIASNFAPSEDSLLFTDQSGITGSYDSGTGVLTLSGPASPADYQAALRSVRYENSSNNPSTGTRTASFQVTDDGGLLSNLATRDITVAASNDAPSFVTSIGALAYTEGDAATAVDPLLMLLDPDDANLEGATVRISAGFESGDELLFTDQLGITGIYNAGTGVLTLTGTSSVANYQTALRSVEYRHTGDDPATSKSVEFRADDGDGLGPASIRNLAVTRVNDAPALDTTNAALAYPEGAGPVAADPGITVTDPDSTQLSGATVQITSNFVAAQDELAFTNQLGITGAYDDTTGTLTLSGTASVANYQAALRAVTYENGSDAPSPPARTLTFRATDAESGTSAPATRDVTLGAANDAATITTTAAALSYTEGDPATTVDDGLTVTDPDDTNLEGATVRISAGFESGDELLFTDQLGITGTYNTGTGVLTLTGTSSVANYQTALRSIAYRHTADNPVTSKTVEFRADDGDGLGPASIRNIAITPIDDPPVAVDDSVTVLQDASATAVDVLANDTDVDGGPKAIASASDPANGEVVLTGGSPGAHTGLTYQPDSGYCNSQPLGTPDTFTYAINGGSSATVSVTVTCPDDPPSAVDDSATVGEDSGATAIDVLANDTDTDGGPKVIASASDPANGTVVLTGGSPGAHTGLTYQPEPDYCNNPPGTTPDTFTYTLNGGSTATVSVTATCVDDAPLATIDGATVAEDASATAIDVLANDTDIDGGPKTISSASDPANGTVALMGGSPGAHTGLTYQPDPNYCNSQPLGTPDTFTYTLNGGSTATVSVTVTCAPDNPVVDSSAGATSYTENGAATAIDPAVTLSDADLGATITGATVQITGGYAGAEDILALAGSHPGITPSVSGDTLTLTGTASPAAYQAALRDVTYRNSSDSPSTDARTVTFSATDETALTGSDIKGITVTAVDDPPVAVDDSATVLEDAAATAVPVLTNDTDVDAGPKTISSASDPANGTVVLTGGSPGAHTGLTYQPDPNYCNDPPGTTPDTFTYTLNGGDSATVSMTVTCVNDPPVADDETFNGNDSAHGNTTMQVDDPDDNKSAPTQPHTEITGDILAGDTDIDGPGPLTVTPGTFATNDGGSVTIEADGDFTFQPAASVSCTDTSDFFDYTVEDSGSPEQTDTGRVTIAIAGCVWYVSNNAAGNSGTSSQPFDTLAQAETASGTNHTVFVFDGDNTSTGYATGYAMNAGERLIGEHEGLVVDPDGGGALTGDTLHPATPGARPTLTATNEDVVALDDGNELRGFNLDPSGTSRGIAGGTGDTGGSTIDDVNILDTGTAGSLPGLELSGTTGTHNITGFTYDNTGAPSSASAVSLANAGTVDFGSTTITKVGAKGLDAGTTNMGTSTFDQITVTGSNSGGVSMVSTTGSTTFGDGSVTDLSLTTSGGSQAAFSLANAGTVSVPAGGTANLSATGGPAVDVTGTAGASLAFDDVDSTNSIGDGINLAGLGTGTFTATSGDISGASQIAFDLDGGSGAITYPGNLNNGPGVTAVDVTGRSGGAVTLSGAIADTNDAGGGISLSGNTGGSTTFSGASKVLNTTTANAVSFTGSDGHTLNITNGGLDVDTTSGQGVVATTSGTINVTGTGNTVASTTGRAVNVQSTDFGAPGFTFQSVSSNGAPNGILLNSTGTTAGMTITGTGAANSGGTIQNATEHGVSLTTTNSFNADELSITGANFAGVDGTDVTNFTFTDGEILNAGDSQINNLHGAIAFNDQAANENNVDGTLVITGNVLKDHYGGGVDVFNRSGTIADATVSNNAIDSAADEALSREDAISFNLFGSASTVASLTKAQIEDNVITDHPSGNGIVILGAQTNISPAPTPTIGVPGSATNRILIDGNLLTGDPTLRFGGAGILAGVEGRGVANFDITNNGSVASPITNVGTHGIATGNSGSSEVEYLIQGNRVNANNFEGGGLGIRSASDQHIMVGGTTLATPILKTIIANNHVRNTTGGGIRVLASNSNGTSEVKVQNNDIANGAAGSFPIRVENGSSADAAFDPTMCATISGNTTAANAPTPGGNTAPGIGLFKRSMVAANYQFGIVGLSPSPSTNANTEAFVTGQNPASSLGGGFWAGKRVTVDAGDNFVSCAHPPGF